MRTRGHNIVKPYSLVTHVGRLRWPSTGTNTSVKELPDNVCTMLYQEALDFKQTVPKQIVRAFVQL